MDKDMVLMPRELPEPPQRYQHGTESADKVVAYQVRYRGKWIDLEIESANTLYRGLVSQYGVGGSK